MWVNIPREWVANMKKCIATLAPAFNTNRMVKDYTEKLYMPSLRRSRLLGDDNIDRAIEFAHQKVKLRNAWDHVKVESVDADVITPLGVNDTLNISVVVDLADLLPSEVGVQIFAGLMDNDGQIGRSRISLRADGTDRIDALSVKRIDLLDRGDCWTVVAENACVRYTARRTSCRVLLVGDAW